VLCFIPSFDADGFICDIGCLADEENYFAHLYTMFLLAQFREPKAYPLMLYFLMTHRKKLILRQ